MVTSRPDDLDLAVVHRRRDDVASRIEGWGVVFVILGTAAGATAIVAGLILGRAWMTISGAGTLLLAFLAPAVCNWAAQVLHTLGRIEDTLTRRLPRIQEALGDRQDEWPTQTTNRP